jgi:hypothetical protein
LERQSYSVEGIIKALSELEGDLDAISSKVEELKKHMINKSQEEIENLNQLLFLRSQKKILQESEKISTHCQTQ